MQILEQEQITQEVQQETQTSTQQEVPTLSFEEICPEWSNILAQNGGFIGAEEAAFQADDGKVRSLGNFRCCVVGEAFGLS